MNLYSEKKEKRSNQMVNKIVSNKRKARVRKKLKKSSSGLGSNISSASKVGSEIAKKAIKAGINEVFFDRGSYKYHGRVKALAENAREAGLKF